MNYCRLVATLLFVASADASELPNNPVLQSLVDTGINVGDRQTESLPLPTLGDAEDRDQQRDIVTRVAGRHGWSRFVRDSVVAPIALKLKFVKDVDGNRIGHSVDLWFVAHGSLKILSDDRLIEQFIEPESENNDQANHGEELDAGRLAENGVFPRKSDEFQERFAYAEIPLMDRVRVAGVGHSAYSRNEHSILMAVELDERFKADNELAGRWQAIRADDLGRKVLGAAQTYCGCGGYGKITRLAEPEGALLVECHFVFHEPEEWFSGGNFLRAKLPILIQESVRQFRRRLREAEDAPRDAVGPIVP